MSDRRKPWTSLLGGLAVLAVIVLLVIAFILTLADEPPAFLRNAVSGEPRRLRSAGRAQGGLPAQTSLLGRVVLFLGRPPRPG